jgi:hypothetical protein
MKPGKNSLAIKVYPIDPLKMYTLDQVDWGQIPPDHTTPASSTRPSCKSRTR